MAGTLDTNPNSKTFGQLSVGDKSGSTYAPDTSLGSYKEPASPASPTPPPTAPTPTYSRLPGVSDSQLADAQANQYKVTDPNQAAADYTSSRLSAAQGRINEINDRYKGVLQSELDAQKPANDNTIGRTSALSALMGLSGSSSAGARTANAEQQVSTINQGITSKVNAQKAQELNAIYNRIDDGAEKVAQAQLETNKANQKKLLDDAAANATDTVTALAGTLSQTGKTFDDWKKADNGDALNKLMAQTGKSEYQLRNTWNNAIPEALRPTTHTSYVDDGKGGTIMRQVEFNPITKKAESHDYPIAVPASTFNGEVKPIEGKNGELFVKQADGTYKDVSPNADNTKKLQEVNIKKQEAELNKIKAETSKLHADVVALNQAVDNGITVDPKSNSILAQTGLSQAAFAYATQGTAALARMSEASRKKIMQEWENYAVKKGIDTATFQSQYGAYSKTVGANLLRNNQASVAEAELDATLKNLKTASDDASFKDMKWANVVKMWGGKEFNDSNVSKYAFHLNQLREEFAMYNAALAGQIDDNGNIRQISGEDYRRAEQIIKDGFAKGSITGFEDALTASRDKMKTVLDASVNAQDKQVWKLFGVSENYKDKTTPTQPSQVLYNGKTYNVDANGEMTEAK